MPSKSATELLDEPPSFMKQGDSYGTLSTDPLPEPIVLEGETYTFDPWTVHVHFPEPNGYFYDSLASPIPVYMPEHYLRKFHPSLGDPAQIQQKIEAVGAAGPAAMYSKLSNHLNNEAPKLQSWIYRRPTSQSPWTWVRNPYYAAVDEAGNQLPYLDQVSFKQISPDNLTLDVATGSSTFQLRHLKFSDYTYLSTNQEGNGYQLRYWFPATRGTWTIFPNLNRVIDEDDPSTVQRQAMLRQAPFRQALSLAINRQAIIDAEFNGIGQPAQLDPGPGSPFASETLRNAWVDYDVAQANHILDDLGLTNRDAEGMRTFADGSRMSFLLCMTDSYTPLGPAQFIIDDWAAIGVRAILRNNSRQLFDAERKAMRQDFTVWSGESEYLTMNGVRNFVPVNNWSCWAPGFGMWYNRGGLDGALDNPDATIATSGIVAPDANSPLGANILQLMQAYSNARKTADLAQRQAYFDEIFAINAEQCFTINVASPPPSIVAVDNDLRNVPQVAVDAGSLATPVNAGFETWFFDQPDPSADATSKRAVPNRDSLQASLVTVQPFGQNIQDAAQDGSTSASVDWLGLFAQLFAWLFWIALAGVLLAVARRHPFVAKRLLWLVPTLVIISVIMFTMIRLPPGDMITNEIEALMMEGFDHKVAEAEQKRDFFHLNDSQTSQYFRWVGLYWFIGETVDVPKDAETLAAEQEAAVAQGNPASSVATVVSAYQWPGQAGLLQGHLGYSMRDLNSVNDIVGDRLLLTLIISLGSLALTWAIALPAGIYSAVHQYKISDYVLGVIALFGMCVPNFLLALMCIYAGQQWFGITVTGLFSQEYELQPWSFGKVLDLLKHIWVAIIVLGVGGTAGLMRIMRGNLLDELRKPYVTTARAKGMRPWKLILKYPVRLALNPFVSSIGAIFPSWFLVPRLSRLSSTYQRLVR